jgi:hypothetical protein
MFAAKPANWMEDQVIVIDEFGLRRTFSFASRMGSCRELRAFLCCCALLFEAMNVSITTANASSETFPYEDAVTYCRGNVARPIALGDDQKILCFDGVISPDQDLSSVNDLKTNGLFVVRSFGGDPLRAIALAGLLHDRNAIVVYDYCFSACAQFVFIATDQTMVRKSSIVAWHFARGYCDPLQPSKDQGPGELQRSSCADDLPEKIAVQQYLAEVMFLFYSERVVDPKRFERMLDPPQSFHVTKALKSLLGDTGSLSEYVAWTWYPRFYKNFLKTEITYEAYPESQAEVDEIAARFGYRAGRVIYDP